MTGRAGDFYNAGAQHGFQSRWPGSLGGDEAWKLRLTAGRAKRPTGTSIAALLAELELDSRQVAVEVNLELIPRGLHAERRLEPGDEIEVVTLVGGG